MPRTILLRSSWQTVNIGDIAHTPGMLHLLERHIPDVDVILWPKSIDRGVEPMLRKRFPRLRIVRDVPTWRSPAPRDSDPTRKQALKEAHFWLHGSGSGINEAGDIEMWRATGKPWGVIGASVGVVIGIPDQKEPVISDSLHALLDTAAFVFTRETRSLRVVREAGIRAPQMDFVPDATFALDLRNDKAADAFLKQHGLETDKFICAIPRLRLTPYWEEKPGSQTPEEVTRKKAVNAKWVEQDMAKMREVLTTWVRETGLKVLLCPEMTYQLNLLKPYLYDRLPAEIQAKLVVMDRYWLTDEAASVYRRARVVVSMDCHSPIIANANGRPGFYLRQPEDTWKGQMYPDLGLGDWKFEIQTATGKEIADRLLSVHKNYDAAVALAKRANDRAQERYAVAMTALRRALPPV